VTALASTNVRGRGRQCHQSTFTSAWLMSVRESHPNLPRYRRSAALAVQVAQQTEVACNNNGEYQQRNVYFLGHVSLIWGNGMESELL